MKAIFIATTALFILSCGPSKPTEADLVNQQKLETLVKGRYFKIESDRAMPQTSFSMNQLQNSGILGVGNAAGSINLIGNPNYLKIMGDSVKAELPFYGERRMGGTYGGRDIGIEFDGLLENYSAVWNQKKRRYLIKFNAKSQNETHNVIINLFPNNTSMMIINGVNRTPIQYSGNVKPFDPENKDQ